MKSTSFTAFLPVVFAAMFYPAAVQAQSGTIQFSSLAYSVKESAASAKIAVSRAGGSAGTIAVNFATSDGTAASGSDYVATNGTLTFGPGVTTLFIHVPIINDVEHEGAETITMELSGESVGANNNATLTVTDNDSCAYSLSPATRTHGPGGGMGSVAVTATAGCVWTASENADWIAIVSGGQSGSGEVQYSFDPNPGAGARAVILTIAGKSFTVRQEGCFVPVAGDYHGLFHETGLFQHQSSGLLGVRLSSLGSFSAKMTLGGKRFSFSGTFAPDGRATNIINRPGASMLSVVLTVDLAGGSDRITGDITDGVWISSAVTDRELFHKTANPAPQAGRYTFIIRGDATNSANEPGGDSYGTVMVDAGGRVKLAGTLADGTKVTQKIPISKNGEWPLYVPLYRSGGAILCRVAFADELESDFGGTLTWFKPVQASQKFYPAGFAEQQALSGSRYQPPAGTAQRVLPFSSGAVEFAAGNLAQDFENTVNLTDASRIQNLGANKLTMTISLPTGLFSGSVTPPGGTRSLPFKGALHQKGNFGSGFFLGTDQSGRVLFGE